MFVLVSTRRPELLSEAVTAALLEAFVLMASIRSPTVSVPVEVYVVVLLPAPKMIWPLVRIPRVNSEVLFISGAVPVPVAGAGAGVEELGPVDEFELEDADEPVEPVAADLLEAEVPLALPELPCSTFWIAAVSWLLTRVSAVPLAMLERPVDRFVVAPNI